MEKFLSYVNYRKKDTYDEFELESGDENPADFRKVSRNARSDSLLLFRSGTGFAFMDRLQAWQGLAFLGAIISFVTLIVNVIVLIWVLVGHEKNGDNYIIYSGSCSKTRQISAGWHILINILSTALLGTSNAVIQVCCAPTRREVDHAHAKGCWVNVGCFGWRNLRFISRKRIILILILGISSIPLHLLYNSTIFANIAAVSYNTLKVTPDFIDGVHWNNTLPYLSSPTEYQFAWNTTAVAEKIDFLQSQVHQPYFDTNMTSNKCLETFGQQYQSQYKDVLIIAHAAPRDTNTSLLEPSVAPAVSTLALPAWMCDARSHWPCTLNSIKKSPEWTVDYPQNQTDLDALSADYGSTPVMSAKVDYCLSHKIPEFCTVQFSRSIMLIVILCNLAKFAMFLICVRLERFEPLITIGDAVCTFLEKPDETTKMQPLLDIRQVRKGFWVNAKGTQFPVPHDLMPNKFIIPGQRWTPPRKKPFWFSAASKHQWILAGFLSMVILLTGLICLCFSGALDGGLSSSIGNADMNYSSANTYGLVANVLLANIVQLAISTTYLIFNGIFTSMMVAREYLDYATQRKPLRVSLREGYQRSTYWLQLPKRYALPLLGSMALLHWLVSESLFLVHISAVDETGLGAPQYPGLSGLGWSPTAILISLLVGLLVMVSLFGSGSRRFPSDMPIASTCSVAISSRCHGGPSEGPDAVKRPLRYGTVAGRKGGADKATFSSRKVGPLVDGKVYVD